MPATRCISKVMSEAHLQARPCGVPVGKAHVSLDCAPCFTAARELTEGNTQILYLYLQQLVGCSRQVPLCLHVASSLTLPLACMCTHPLCKAGVGSTKLPWLDGKSGLAAFSYASQCSVRLPVLCKVLAVADLSCERPALQNSPVQLILPKTLLSFGGQSTKPAAIFVTQSTGPPHVWW